MHLVELELPHLANSRRLMRGKLLTVNVNDESLTQQDEHFIYESIHLLNI